MNFYKIPLWVASPMARICKYFPKQIRGLRYFLKYNRFINWKHPKNIQEYSVAQSFNPATDIELWATLADKVRVRDFVKERIGEQYLPKLYGVYNSAREINFDMLPDRFVLKTNNGCGTNIIVRDKTTLNKDVAIKNLDRWLRFPYGELTGQLHYTKIKPLILAEQYLEQSASEDILPYDYKFLCCNGKPIYVLFYEGRTENSHQFQNMLLDMDWMPIPDAVKYPITHCINKPKSFEEMKKCVKALCAGFEFVRVDFYEIDGRPVFGEMTFTPTISLNNVPFDFKSWN